MIAVIIGTAFGLLSLIFLPLIALFVWEIGSAFHEQDWGRAAVMISVWALLVSIYVTAMAATASIPAAMS